MFWSTWGGLSHMFEFSPVMHCLQIFQNRHQEPRIKAIIVPTTAVTCCVKEAIQHMG